MPPQLALLLCICCIGWLLRAELTKRKTSLALWIPVFWLLVHGSRPVSSWFQGMGYAADYVTAANEGNPFERNIYFLLIGAALWILSKRHINWRAVIGENRGIFLLFLFFLVSTLWAESPFVSFKRWFKNFGHIIVGLVILTEADPLNALKSVAARCAYLLFPLSALFIKYYPELGRVYSASGEPMFAGVTSQKNKLGEIVFVFGLILLWDCLAACKYRLRDMLNRRVAAQVVALMIGVWLLYMSRSATSFVCTLLGLGILLLWTVPTVRRNGNALIKWVAVVIAVSVLLQEAFDLSGMALEMLGRDRTFTGRSEIWEAALGAGTNPLIGVGFSSFWSSGSAPVTMRGDRMNVVSAHNGYLDAYLDGGLIGVGVLVIMLVLVFASTRRELRIGNEIALVQLMFLVVCATRNFAESSFLKGSPLWFIFLVTAMMHSRSRILALNPNVRVRPRSMPSRVGTGVASACS